MGKFDIYEEITSRACELMEKEGVIPWERPWFGAADGAVSGATGRPYSFINQCLLIRPGRYFTFKQAEALGAHVIKGSKSQIVVFWKQWTTTEAKDDGTTEEKTIPVLRYFNVFHESQIEGLPEAENQPDISHVDPHAEAESIVNDYIRLSGVTLYREELSNQAFYRPGDDSITVPTMEQFSDTAEYYSTLFHEMTHSTGHKSRLARIDPTKDAAFGSEEYSKEELVAEIGAAALVNHCGLENKKSFRNSAAYLQSWLRALKNDKKLLVSATSRAEKAVNMILDPASIKETTPA